MSSAEDEIRAHIEAFTKDLTALVRRKALNAVQAVLAGASSEAAAPAQPKARIPAARRPRAAAAAPPAPAKAAVPRRATKRRAPGQKRDPGEIRALTDKLATFVAGHPGAIMSTISDALAAPSAALRVPASKLLAAGKIRAEGKKQFTKYFPA